jgi:hypothetical protein
MTLRDRLTSLSWREADVADPDRSEASLDAYDEMLAQEAYESDVPGDLLKAVCWYASGVRRLPHRSAAPRPGAPCN